MTVTSERTSTVFIGSPETVSPPIQRILGLWRQRRIGLPSWVILTQLFIGLGWFRAATEKMIDLSWWSGEPTLAFLSEHEDVTLGWYRPFVDLFVVENIVAVSLFVMLAQLVAGVTLLSGRFVALGLTLGVLLNVNFVAAGAVNPSAFYLISQGALALWMVERSQRNYCRSGLRAAVAVFAVLGVASVPFISTLSPEHAVDDPAIMFVTLAGLAALAGDAAHRSIAGCSLVGSISRAQRAPRPGS